MTTITWKITDVKRHPETGVISEAQYAVTARDGDETALVGGLVKFPAPVGEYVPFAEVTEELMIGWVKAQLGDRAVMMEKQATRILEHKMAPKPPALVSGLPWTA